MVEPNTTTQSGWLLLGFPRTGSEGGAVLAAAVAATLAEYRQRVGRQDAGRARPAFEARWRTLARQEQLRGIE